VPARLDVVGGRVLGASAGETELAVALHAGDEAEGVLA